MSACHADFDAIDLKGFDFESRYKLFSGAVIPRPIAWVSSLGPSGRVNLAPFSSFIIASVEEGLLAFSIGPAPGDPKDTLTNIRRTEEFVIHIVPETLAREVQLCAERYPADVSEAELAGLELTPSHLIGTPRIAKTKVQFECRLHDIVQFGQSHLVVGRVLVMHVRKGLVRDGKIDPLALAPLGRIAGRNYCRVADIITV